MLSFDQSSLRNQCFLMDISLEASSQMVHLMENTINTIRTRTTHADGSV